jgi:indole-3-glycerol phosphate synthase
VLLIVAALGRRSLAALAAETRELGMDALVEVHDEEELDAALLAGADMIGINNRDLRTFEVSRDTTRRLAPLVPEGVVAVAESGIGSRAEVRALKPWGVDAVLVGECLMRSPDIAAAARELSDV